MGTPLRICHHTCYLMACSVWVRSHPPGWAPWGSWGVQQPWALTALPPAPFSSTRTVYLQAFSLLPWELRISSHPTQSMDEEIRPRKGTHWPTWHSHIWWEKPETGPQAAQSWALTAPTSGPSPDIFYWGLSGYGWHFKKKVPCGSWSQHGYWVSVWVREKSLGWE